MMRFSLFFSIIIMYSSILFIIIFFLFHHVRNCLAQCVILKLANEVIEKMTSAI